MCCPLKPVIMTKLLFFDSLSIFDPVMYVTLYSSLRTKCDYSCCTVPIIIVSSTVQFFRLNERTLDKIINLLYTAQGGRGSGLGVRLGYCASASYTLAVREYNF